MEKKLCPLPCVESFSNLSNKPNFIIYAPPYKDDSGGIIVLHKLCHLLNELGHQAYLWPNQLGVRPTLWKKIRRSLKTTPFHRNVEFNTPIADKTIFNNGSIVIYSEVDFGNPLSATNVVRWLLHKPGFHTGMVNYGKDELTFFFDDYCLEPGIPVDQDNKLFVLSLNSCYKTDGSKQRSGSCYMMRKGKGRQIVHDLTDSVQIDGLNHQETARIFRKSKYFFSYDELTLYSQYAALCGCISVVIPDKFNTRAEWVEKHPISKYGIAYGLDDIEHALQTQHKVAEYFFKLEAESRETVARFAEVAINHFRR
jgi:hypothetical protein